MAALAPRALIFDFGNVLTDTRPVLEWLADHEARLGIEPGALRQRLWSGEVWEAASTGRISQAAYWQAVSEGLSLPDEMQEFGRRAFFREPFVEQMLALLPTLRRAGRVRLALCSNALASLAELLDETVAIRQNFDLIVISALVGLRKPDPAIFHLCARWLGVQPYECCLIDDKERNTLAAQVIGMPGITHIDALSTIAQLSAWGLID